MEWYGKSKRVVLVDGAFVEKTARGGRDAGLLKQAQRLGLLGDLGFAVSRVVSVTVDRLVSVYIPGPTLAEVKSAGGLSTTHTDALARLREQQRVMAVYIGDLNHRNLIWSKGQWWIVDCGAVRVDRPPDYVEDKLRIQWMKWTA